MSMALSIKYSLAAVSAAVLLTACGGSDDAPAKVATADATFQISSSNAQAAATLLTSAATSFTFASGAPELGTNTSTKVDFGGTAAAPTVAVTSTQGTASGTLGFGSCILTITSSTFTSGPLQIVPPATSKTVTINPCELTADTSGNTVGTPVANEAVSLTFGTTESQTSNISGTVTVNDNGQVIITPTGGTAVPVGTVPTGEPTGSAG